MVELAREAGLDMVHFSRLINSGEARAAILAEGKLGQERYNVRGTPTIMLEDGTKLRHPMAYPKIRDGRIVSVSRLPCFGEGCDDLVRALFDQALNLTPDSLPPKA